MNSPPWFETRSFAALLTMRQGMLRCLAMTATHADLILEERPQGASRRIAAMMTAAFLTQQEWGGNEKVSRSFRPNATSADSITGC
jgi:hypothetical protein